MATITLEVPDHLVSMLNTIRDQLPIVLEMGMSRWAPVSSQAYGEVIALFVKNASPEAIASFRFSEEIEDRINDLVAKSKNDQLSMAENVELDRLVELEEQIILVKARARAQLSPA